MRIALILILLTFLFFSCQENDLSEAEREVAELEKVLPGTWEAVSLYVEMPTVGGSDSSVVFEIQENQWERRYMVKPTLTYFELDKKYRQEYRGLNDSLIDQNRGIWNVFGDTLLMISPKDTNRYLLETGKGLATFRGTVDWDGDGEEDDTYRGVFRKVSISTK